jgi:hypothetical protein
MSHSFYGSESLGGSCAPIAQVRDDLNHYPKMQKVIALALDVEESGMEVRKNYLRTRLNLTLFVYTNSLTSPIMNRKLNER